MHPQYTCIFLITSISNAQRALHTSMNLAPTKNVKVRKMRLNEAKIIEFLYSSSETTARSGALMLAMSYASVEKG